ncbi:MAG: deoxyribose-phosphate aldolase [Acidimicrobiales bacterium]
MIGRAELARRIDHTLLDPLATPGQVAMFLADAATLGVGAVCVSPSRLPLPAGSLPPAVAVAAVVGFPSGAHRPEVKAQEARLAVEAGATELDLVIDLGLAKAGLWLQVEAEVAAVRHAAPAPVLLKVIIEAAALPGDVAVVAACHAAVAAGADMVKTSTGMHPAGGATVHHVALMADAVGGRLGVKAAGGIRDAATALAMLDAGATRLGCSATRAILDGL